MTENEKEKPTVNLSESNGNAFSIIVKIRRVLVKAGYSRERIEEFSKEATSGDYDHVIQTAMKWCDVE